jgi:hypothetical protein
MGNRHDDRSSRMSTRNDDPRQRRVRSPRQGGARAHERGVPARAFDRDADMGGSSWSGASGRGGMDREPQQHSEQPNRGYASGGAYVDTDAPDYDSGYNHEGGYSHVGGYAGSRGYSHDRGRYTDEGGFVSERGFGHVPGQGWHGGYGGDRDRSGYDAHPDRSAVGRGFTGNDFATGRDYPQRDYPQREYAQRDSPQRDYPPRDYRPRHFGTPVDRGGRMGPGGESTTGRGYWGWDSDRASGVNVGTMGGREGWDRDRERQHGYRYGYGYGYQGTDMGMGVPDEDRGPHYGKGPKGYKRSDERTREDVCDAIAHHGHVDASDVEVKVESGIVTLSGTVAQRHEKRALEHLVERCRGVHEVHNELRLKRPETKTEKRAPSTKAPQATPARSAQSDDTANGDHENGKGARA